MNEMKMNKNEIGIGTYGLCSFVLSVSMQGVGLAAPSFACVAKPVLSRVHASICYYPACCTTASPLH
jgi:hypothetical protein